jgi:hypothetical protein
MGFLAELTDEERTLTADRYLRKRALAEKLRAELPQQQGKGANMVAISKLPQGPSET